MKSHIYILYEIYFIMSFGRNHKVILIICTHEITLSPNKNSDLITYRLSYRIAVLVPIAVVLAKFVRRKCTKRIMNSDVNKLKLKRLINFFRWLLRNIESTIVRCTSIKKVKTLRRRKVNVLKKGNKVSITEVYLLRNKNFKVRRMYHLKNLKFDSKCHTTICNNWNIITTFWWNKWSVIKYNIIK